MYMQQSAPLLRADTPCYREKNMAKLNVSQAARAAGVARITIQRYIKKGKLTCDTNGAGNKLIDPAELIRVFGDLKSDGDTPDAMQQESGKLQQDTPGQVQVLQEKVLLLEGQIDDLKKDKEDWKRDKGLFQARETDLLDIIKHQTRLLDVPEPQKPTHTSQEAVNQPDAISEIQDTTSQSSEAVSENDETDEPVEKKKGFFGRIFRKSS